MKYHPSLDHSRTKHHTYTPGNQTNRPSALPGKVRYRHHWTTKALALLLAMLIASPAWALESTALPDGGTISAGSGNISSSAANMTITQDSQNLAINWQSYDIGSAASVTYVQPSSSAVALNRVIGTGASEIYGKLNANGQVFLLNSNGILFGENAQVNVGGLVASTLSLSDDDFMAGTYSFSGTAGSIVNQGTITSQYVALLGGQVSNQGTISAKLGKVILAAGETMTLDFAGDGLTSISVDEGTLNALAENKQLIMADGGTVIMTAAAANSLIQAVVNNEGVIEANSVEDQSGTIVLLSDMDNGLTSVSGTLSATADAGDGGFIETSGAQVQIADDASITTLATNGTTGTWLIDPTDFTIESGSGAATTSSIGAETLATNLETTNVEIQTDNSSGSDDGDINVNAAVSWDAATTLTLNAYNDININADISASSGTLKLYYGQGSSAGGSSSYTLNNDSAISLSAGNHFYTKLGSDGTETEWTVITELGEAGSRTGSDLQGISWNLSGNYVLGADIDASATASWNYDTDSSTYLGFDPLGTYTELDTTNAFTGNFDGLGHTISHLTINRSSEYEVGLFGCIYDSDIANLGLLEADISGRSHVGALIGLVRVGNIFNSYATGTVTGYSSVGGLIGEITAGTISTSYASGAVTGEGDNVGGLVGEITAGTISTSYATGAVTGEADDVGGLVGDNDEGTISTSYATGTVSGIKHVGGLVGIGSDISDSYATGTVSGTSSVGGLVGSGSDISDSYATGAVTGTSSVGGLAGSGLTISDSYATGAVTGETNVGGLAGSGSDISDSYATGAVTGETNVGGLVGNSTSGTISTSYATGTVSGDDNVGGLVGREFFLGKISTSYATGAVTGINYVGGLVGITDSSTSTISTSYATGAVTGDSYVGGLLGGIGSGIARINNSYATGAVTGNSYVGGLLGASATWGAIINNSYATGAVTGDSYVGGLIGYLKATDTTYSSISNSFWNTETTGQSSGCGGNDTADAPTGLTTAQMTSYATFSSLWDISDTGGSSAVWRIYDGYTYPLLRSFLSELTVTATSGTRTYDATTNGLGVSYSSPVDETLLFGEESVTTSKDAGTQTVTSKLYSNQQGYDITTIDGTLTITPATLTTSGTLTGIYSGDSVSLVQSDASFSDKNASANKTVTFSNSLSGSDASNYQVAATGTTTATITPATLTVGGTSTASNKVYDATTSATVTGATISGILASDDVTLTQSGSFADKNVGTGKTVTYSNSLSGTDASNYVLDSSGGTTTADITPATLTVSGTAASNKVYDATTAATVTGATISGILASDDVTLTQSGTFSDKNVGTDKTVTYSNSISGTDAANYKLNSSGGTTTANITAATLNIGGTVASDKVYDGTTDATLSTSGTLTGIYSGDSVSLVQSDASFSDKNVGDDKTVTFSNSLSGSDADNYVIASSGTTTADITTATLTLSGTTASNKTYDSTTTATVSGSTITGIIGDDDVALDQTATFADKNVGSDKTVTFSNSLSGSDAGNYVIVSSGTTTADITTATLTLSGTTASNKVYDSTTNATVSGSTITGIIGDDDVTLDQTATFADKNVGTDKTVNYTNSLSGSDAGNYVIVSSGTTTADITAASLTVSGTTASDKTYDSTTVASLSGSMLSGVISDDAVTLSQTATFSDKNAGTDKTVTYVNSISGSDAGNYVITSSGTTTADITAATLTVSGTTASDKTYDGTTVASLSNSTLSGVISDDDVSLAQTATFSDQNVGTNKTVTYSNSISGSDASNYIIASSGTTTADITAAALTVTVNSDSKVYDGSSYSGGHGVSYSGFAAGEDASVLTGELIYGGTAQGATNIGHYSLTATGLAADNYTINYIDSSLVISPNTGYEAALYYADTLHSLPTDSQQEENQDMIAHTTIIAGGIRLPADLAR